MKRTYVKPTMNMEQFAANQYVAACYNCITSGQIGQAGFAGECNGTHTAKKNFTTKPCTSVHVLSDAAAAKLKLAHIEDRDLWTGTISNVRYGYVEQTVGTVHFMVPNANASN